MVARDGAALDAGAEELRQEYAVEVVCLSYDLAEEDAALHQYRDVSNRQIRVDVLVNNAGIGQREKFHASELDDDLSIMNLNVIALVKLTKFYVREMVARGSGRILNLGSIAGFRPGPLLAVYHASKAFVVSFSEAVAEELQDTGVTMTVLCPGPTDTEFFRRADMENARILEEGIVIDADEVARIGFESLDKGERLVIPGFSNRATTFSRRLIPGFLQGKIHRKMYEVKEES